MNWELAWVTIRLIGSIASLYFTLRYGYLRLFTNRIVSPETARIVKRLGLK